MRSPEAIPVGIRPWPSVGHRRLWRVAIWLPVCLAVAYLAWSLWVTAAHGPGAAGEPDRATQSRRVWRLELAWMSGGGLAGSWLLFLGWLARRRWPAWPGAAMEAALAGAATVVVLVLFGSQLIAHCRADSLPYLIAVFAPTLLTGLGLIGSGLRRLDNAVAVAGILGGFALLNLAFQLRYGPSTGTEAQVLQAFGLDSVLIGVAIAIRLGIWGFTNEGAPRRPRT